MRLAALMLVLSMLGLAAGCGGDDTKTVTRTVSAPPATTETTPPTATDDAPPPPETVPGTIEDSPPATTTTNESGGTPAAGSPTQADAQDAARTAANDYTRDEYGISGTPDDWSATCTGEGSTFSCAVEFNGGQCSGRLTLSGSELTPGNQRIGCGE
jgi:hypothetical protein